jgi:ketosteroid isomerase-like protein
VESSEQQELPSAADEQAVRTVLQEFLDAIAAGDKTAMCALLVPDGWAVHSRDGRVFHQRLWDLAERLPGGNVRIEEHIHDPLVRVDDDIAMIWCPYEVYRDGEPHHWGTNIASFMKTDGRWRICGITDNGRSGRRPG